MENRVVDRTGLLQRLLIPWILLRGVAEERDQEAVLEEDEQEEEQAVEETVEA